MTEIEKTLHEKAQELFERHPNQEVLYATTDGNFFFGREEHMAREHARKFGQELFRFVTETQVEAASTTVDPAKEEADAKEAAAKEAAKKEAAAKEAAKKEAAKKEAAKKEAAAKEATANTNDADKGGETPQE